MQTSAIKKLLHPIKALLSRGPRKLSAATSESEEVSDMREDVTEQGLSPEESEETVTETEAEETEVYEEYTEPEITRQSNKAHLSSSVPRGARVPTGALSKGEMAEIRSIFGNMDDAEIQRLYKRVTK